MRNRLLSALLLAAACLPAQAAASSSQFTIFQDDGRVVHRGPDVRAAALQEISENGAEVVKINLTWSEVAPGGATRPDGFQGHDPASYPSSAWEKFDAAIRAAQARGLRVLLAPTTPAPGWATATRGDEQGVNRPDVREFGAFVRAAGTRYDGAHGQPRVDFWSISNEPNHPDFLQPLSSRRGTPIAPRIYRDMVRQAVAGLRLSGHGGDTILFGELLPIGQRRAGPRNTIRPVHFLREFFCLDRRYRPYRGRAARVRGCSRFRRVSGVSGFAYHPYTRPNGPRGREPSADDATIRSIGRITRVLDRAASARRLSGRRMRVYNTEFGYQSNPPDPFQTRISRIPAFLNEAEWISFRNGRVASWSQYALVDDAVAGSGNARFGGFQSGLRFENGDEKPGVYDAYRVPLFVRLLGSKKIEVWGGARAATAGHRIRIQQRLGRGEFTDLGVVTIGSPRGYFRRRLRVSGAARRSYRLVYEDRGTTRSSRVTRAARR